MKQDFINNWRQLEPITAATAIGLGITAASAGGQIYAQGKMNRKTREWNEKMYGIQRADAIADRDYNSSEAQVKRLKEAGLNPALLYGQTGAGGQTQTRGSSPGSWNPEVPNISGMGLMAGQQVALLQAQVENIKADTADKLANLPNKGALTGNIEADTENKKLASIIADYTGKELKDVYEKVKVPNRGQESETYSKEMQARQGVLDILREQYENGNLAKKANAEVERELLNNAKTREETRNIVKTFDLLEQNIKGQSIENAFKELDMKLQKETGVDRSAPGWQKTFGRLLMLLAGE